jgi:hypothetical protein
VLPPLVETFPRVDWERQPTWFWHRVVQHGCHRAEEIREVAVTVRDVGIAPRTATATAEMQAWLTMLRSEGVFADAASGASWRELADRIKIESKNLSCRRPLTAVRPFPLSFT